MHDRDRFKLLHGPYKMPRCKIGGVLQCELRGEVIVRGISAGQIAWPFTRVGKRNNGPACLILCAGLVEAVKHESAAASPLVARRAFADFLRFSSIPGGVYRAFPLKLVHFTPRSASLIW